jgi:hypothetical protein
MLPYLQESVNDGIKPLVIDDATSRWDTGWANIKRRQEAIEKALGGCVGFLHSMNRQEALDRIGRLVQPVALPLLSRAIRVETRKRALVVSSHQGCKLASIMGDLGLSESDFDFKSININWDMSNSDWGKADIERETTGAYHFALDNFGSYSGLILGGNAAKVLDGSRLRRAYPLNYRDPSVLFALRKYVCQDWPIR